MYMYNINCHTLLLQVNNNNNNNLDINYNTINQDSSNVVSNSENTNMVMAIILLVPGKRYGGTLYNTLGSG